LAVKYIWDEYLRTKIRKVKGKAIPGQALRVPEI
jgi:hypothetical protein